MPHKAITSVLTILVCGLIFQCPQQLQVSAQPQSQVTSIDIVNSIFNVSVFNNLLNIANQILQQNSIPFNLTQLTALTDITKAINLQLTTGSNGTNLQSSIFQLVLQVGSQLLKQNGVTIDLNLLFSGIIGNLTGTFPALSNTSVLNPIANVTISNDTLLQVSVVSNILKGVITILQTGGAGGQKINDPMSLAIFSMLQTIIDSIALPNSSQVSPNLIALLVMQTSNVNISGKNVSQFFQEIPQCLKDTYFFYETFMNNSQNLNLSGILDTSQLPVNLQLFTTIIQQLTNISSANPNSFLMQNTLTAQISSALASLQNTSQYLLNLQSSCMLIKSLQAALNNSILSKEDIANLSIAFTNVTNFAKDFLNFFQSQYLNTNFSMMLTDILQNVFLHINTTINQGMSDPKQILNILISFMQKFSIIVQNSQNVNITQFLNLARINDTLNELISVSQSFQAIFSLQNFLVDLASSSNDFPQILKELNNSFTNISSVNDLLNFAFLNNLISLYSQSPALMSTFLKTQLSKVFGVMANQSTIINKLIAVNNLNQIIVNLLNTTKLVDNNTLSIIQRIMDASQNATFLTDPQNGLLFQFFINNFTQFFNQSVLPNVNLLQTFANDLRTIITGFMNRNITDEVNVIVTDLMASIMSNNFSPTQIQNIFICLLTNLSNNTSSSNNIVNSSNIYMNQIITFINSWLVTQNDLFKGIQTSLNSTSITEQISIASGIAMGLQIALPIFNIIPNIIDLSSVSNNLNFTINAILTPMQTVVTAIQTIILNNQAFLDFIKNNTLFINSTGTNDTSMITKLLQDSIGNLTQYLNSIGNLQTQIQGFINTFITSINSAQNSNNVADKVQIAVNSIQGITNIAGSLINTFNNLQSYMKSLGRVDANFDNFLASLQNTSYLFNKTIPGTSVNCSTVSLNSTIWSLFLSFNSSIQTINTMQMSFNNLSTFLSSTNMTNQNFFTNIILAFQDFKNTQITQLQQLMSQILMVSITKFNSSSVNVTDFLKLFNDVDSIINITKINANGMNQIFNTQLIASLKDVFTNVSNDFVAKFLENLKISFITVDSTTTTVSAGTTPLRTTTIAGTVPTTATNVVTTTATNVVTTTRSNVIQTDRNTATISGSITMITLPLNVFTTIMCMSKLFL